MRPDQLKSPFSWKERQVLIKDRVWYVPDYCDRYQEFIFPGWQHADLFGNENPICIEYCSGNGHWIASKAQEFPHYNWVAVEMDFERARKIWSKLKNYNLSNLLIICGEALTATSHYFPPSSISQIFINFPDPWPKNRHAKNRLIQQAFLQELQRVLKKKATVDFVTDDEKYSEWTLRQVAKCGGFDSEYSNGYITDNPGYGYSSFYEIWLSQGKEIRFHRFIKREV